MTTARVVVTRSLKLLRVIAAEETPTASQMADGLDSLNDLLHSLKSHNADIDHQDLTADDDLPVPPEHIRPIKYLLASEMAPEYGTQLTPEVAVEAKAAMPTLQAYYRRTAKLRVDDGIHPRLGQAGYDITRDI